MRPYMESHGGNVELLSLDNDVARLRLVGHCKSCPSSAVTLELALKQAIEEACPDLLSFECEGVAEAAKSDEVHIPNAAPSWTELDDVHELAEGGLLSVSAAGIPLVLCKTEGRLYAYRNRCPACNMPLHLGTLNRTLLSCRAGHCYDIQRAGRAVGSANLHLDPFPLLASGGSRQSRIADRAARAASLPLNRSSHPRDDTGVANSSFYSVLRLPARNAACLRCRPRCRRFNDCQPQAKHRSRGTDRHLLGRRSRTHNACESAGRSSCQVSPSQSALG